MAQFLILECGCIAGKTPYIVSLKVDCWEYLLVGIDM